MNDGGEEDERRELKGGGGMELDERSEGKLCFVCKINITNLIKCLFLLQTSIQFHPCYK